MALEPKLVQCIPLAPSPDLGTLALAGLDSEFQRPKVAIVLTKSIASHLDVGLNDGCCRIQLTAPGDGCGGIATEMNTLAVHALAGDLPLARNFLGDPQALRFEVFSLPQQAGKRPLPVVDRRFGDADRAVEFRCHLLPLAAGLNADDFSQCSKSLIKRCQLCLVLTEKRLKSRIVANCFFNLGIGTAAVGAETDQLSHILIGCDEAAGACNKHGLLRSVAPRHGAGNAFQKIDRREPAAFGNRAIKNDVAIKDSAYGVGNRLVMVIALNQNGEQAGDAPLAFFAGTRTLQQTR